MPCARVAFENRVTFLLFQAVRVIPTFVLVLVVALLLHVLEVDAVVQEPLVTWPVTAVHATIIVVLTELKFFPKGEPPQDGILWVLQHPNFAFALHFSMTLET